MSTKILLRIAAIIMLFHGLVLVVGSVVMDPPANIPSEMADFYVGAAYTGMLTALLIGVLVWTLSCRTDKQAIQLLWIITTATALLGIIEIVYFFPYIVCWLPAALSFIALFKLNKQISKKI